MAGKKQTFGRLRMDSGHHRRIGVVILLLGVLAFVPATLRLCSLMVGSYAYYAEKALRNQTRTTHVAADRGDIFDRNMNLLATDTLVEEWPATKASCSLSCGFGKPEMPPYCRRCSKSAWRPVSSLWT